MSKKRIAFLGPSGTYSSQAVEQLFGESNENYEFVAEDTIKSCFSALTGGKVSTAVVPFANSSNGPVMLTYDLLKELSPRPAAIAQTDIAVNHYVVASSATLSRIEDLGESAIAEVYSHPQVWGQCTQYLSTHFLYARHVDVDSTARAAQLVVDRNDAVAICSIAATQVADVQVYASEIQDRKGNYTRFIAIRPYQAGAQRTSLDEWISKELEKY
ncbi:PheA Prephenate dehydratase [Lipomyces oligophaga]|uniref:PheA Prephenate dehydratase n=1 Tax=Lipomyces oligophaga TaxID=45792 RepID=UPI0034CDD14D